MLASRILRPLVLLIAVSACSPQPPTGDDAPGQTAPGVTGIGDTPPPAPTGLAAQVTVNESGTVTVNEDGTVTVSLTVAGVEGACADLLSVTTMNAALLAQLSVQGVAPACTLIVTPAADASGTGALVVTLTQGTTAVSVTIQVEVAAVNDPPRLDVGDGVYMLTENQVNPLSFSVFIADDGVIDCSDLVTSQVGTLASALTVTDGAIAGECLITAVLVPDAFGSGTVALTLTDRDGLAVQETLTLQVAEVNDPPSIALSSNTLVAFQNATATLRFSVADSDGSAACSATVASGATGLVEQFGLTASTGDCVLTLSLVPGVNGEGTVSLVTSDARGLASSSASFALLVLPAGNGTTPVFARAPADIYTLEDAQNPPTTSFRVADPDGVVGCTNVTATDSPLYTSAITITDDGTGLCVVSVQLTPNSNGDDPIVLTLTDGDGHTATATFTLHVASSIDSPAVVLGTTGVTTFEDAPNPVVSFSIFDIEHPATPLNCTTAVFADLLSGTGGLVTGLPVGAGAATGECVLTIQLGKNANGSANVRLSVTDTTPRSTTVVFPLVVTPVPDAPRAVFANDPITTPEDTPFHVDFTLVDDDGGAVPSCTGVTASADDAPVGLIESVTVSGYPVTGVCRLSVTPVADAHGSGPINVTVTGSDLLQSTSAVTLVVASVGDVLTISDTPDQVTIEDTPFTVTVAILGDGPLACDAAHLVAGPAGTTLAFSGSPASCEVTITPPHNVSGAITVTLTAVDGMLQASDTFELAITPVVDDMCLAENGNGGCQQRCLSSVNEVTTCGCFPGFVASGQSCLSAGDVTLLNAGLNRFFDVAPSGAAPRVLGLRSAGRPVEMTQVAGSNDVFTFTVHETPGTCANGATSPSCEDSYRLCASALGGINVQTAWSSQRSGTPSAWDSPLCAWTVTDLGGGQVRLKNQGLPPYIGYLTCPQSDFCGVTYENDTAGNTTFLIASEQCVAGTAGCSTNATCTNAPSGAVCACKPHYSGDGASCAAINACATTNGGCGQTCAGTAADDSAICTCAPGFDLAPDHKACTPRAETRLFNDGLNLYLSLPPAPSLTFFAPTGNSAQLAPLVGATNAFTITFDAPSATHRLCSYAVNQAGNLTWTDGQPAPTDWDSLNCGWYIVDAGNGKVRLLNAGVQQNFPFYGYLNCVSVAQCWFNSTGDESGNTLFTLDQDECAAHTTTCDAHADCTNSVGSYSCACGPGYSGNGQSCVLTNACAIGNGGCSQTCAPASNGSPICGCFAGGALNVDGTSCDPVPGGRLYNVGLDDFIAANPSFPQSSFRFIFKTPGDDLRVQPAQVGPAGSKTIDMTYRPGTCANGTISNACPDTYRMCVVQSGGSRLGVTRSNAQIGEPGDWNSLECAWLVEEIGNNQVRLKNAWLQQVLPHIDYLACGNEQDCTFTLNEGTAGNTEFVIDADECAIGTDTCDPNAVCTNTVGSFSCACASGYVGDGLHCALVNPCVVDNGGCSQLCSNAQPGQSTCGCFPGFTVGASGACEPPQRMRLLNEGVNYVDLNALHQVSLSVDGGGIAVDPVPGFHDRFTLTMATAPGTCADGSTNIFCPDLYRLCTPALIGGTPRLISVARNAQVGDPANWNSPECTWIFEPVSNDHFRMRNLWLEQTPSMAHHDYLYCGTGNVCEFTINNSVAEPTLFTLDVDSCADGSACDANATCTDTRTGPLCECNDGYGGSGQTCVLENVCVVRNGGCQQECNGTVGGVAQCGCAPGFALNPDGRTCTARPALRLFNVGVNEYLDHQPCAGIGQLTFSPQGRTVRMEQTLDGPDTFTFTVEVTPGTCANGSTRDQCPNLYRMCAQDNSGFRWKTEQLSDYGGGKPALWDAPECKWRVKKLPGGKVQLWNLWLQDRHPYLSNLICTGDGSDCFFNYGTDNSDLSTFAVYTDECSASAPVCDTHATCKNLAGADTCVCDENWSGNGTSCTPNNACVVDNGGCQQACSSTGGTATCGCWAGFDRNPDGSCSPWPDVRLVSGAFGLKASWTVANGLRFDAAGQPMRVEVSPLGTNAVTLTLDVSNGDQVRICAGQPSGFTWIASHRASGSPVPSNWTAVECAWRVEGADGAAVRLRNLWIEQQYPQFDYLECWNSANCGFTYLDEKTPQSVFLLQSDQCSVANVCGAHATCTNTATSHTCTCEPGYSGDGQTCALFDSCLVNNGDCSQRCTHTAGGPLCWCYPGFALDVDGQSCAPVVGTVKLFNEGWRQFADVADNGQIALMGGAGADVRVEAVASNLYTFTVNYGDDYRLCVYNYSGFRTQTLRRAPAAPAPAGWDGPECQWSIVPAGADHLRLKNAWLQQSYPYADFLNPRTQSDWQFTYDESTAGATLFSIDADECALNTDECSPNAACTNTSGGYTCSCLPRFTGDGRTCTPDGPCVVNNGGCAQTCSEVGGSPVCGCYPGFAANGNSCTSSGTVVLYNVGLGKSLNIAPDGEAPFTFEFTTLGRGIRMEPAGDGRHDTFRFTFDYQGDEYRMCAGDDSGYRWIETWHQAGHPLPATWNGPECTWIIENLANGQFNLRNLWASQNRSYVDYLNCKVGYDCLFTHDDSTPATATFGVVGDVCTGGNLCQSPRSCLNGSIGGTGYECSACPDGYTTNGPYQCTDRNECQQGATCGTNAHCENFDGGFACVCDPSYVGDGQTCVQPGDCATNNGGCSQLCAAPSGPTAVCSCYPGFTASGSACNSVGDINLGNVELGLWLTMDTSFAPPYRFEFRADPAKVKMEQVAGSRKDTFTFTVQHPTGTCGAACTDQYRMCVINQSGFRVGRILRAAGAPAPTDWDSAQCQWQVVSAGSGQLRLRNAFLQTSYPYTEYLTCEEANSSCVFNYDPSGAGNTTFRVNTDGQNLCTGVVCTAKDQCHGPGTCYPLSGLCSDPVLPVGSACDDGNAAATGDTCSSGVCINGGDRDGDGVPNASDVCIGDDLTGDLDGDGRCDDSDNCLGASNVNQLDTDRDGIGNTCDNCPNTSATNQDDADNDGVGNVCDADYRPPSPGPEPSAQYSPPQRPACGFTPVCPGTSNANKYNSYLFGCYAEEPNGGLNCLGDRWYHHLSRRIYPAVLTTTAPGTVDGVLNELAKPENNVATSSCTTTDDCTAPATCEGHVCTMPAVKDFIDRLTESSNFLSCTSPNAYEKTWPTARVVPLDTGPCDALAEYNRIYGYRVSNTTAAPMTIWVTKARGQEGRWWTINPGEEIRFNVFGSALLFATTAEAYRVCQPGFMTKTVNTYNLTQLTAGREGWGTIRVPQTAPVELVRYTVGASYGGGSLVITRDRELTLDIHLYVYPNYFGVGTPPYPQYSTSDVEQLIITLARNVNGFSPVKEGGLRVISPERYPVLACEP